MLVRLSSLMAKCYVSGSWPDDGRDGSSSSSLKGPLLLPRQAKPPSSTPEGRNSAALRIHSEAEKRRRERINAHLSTLSRMIPNSSKEQEEVCKFSRAKLMDKAALLGRVIEHLKDLKRKAMDMNQNFMVPAEANEVNVEIIDAKYQHAFPSPSEEEDKLKLYIKASVCCDDRPDLFEDLIGAFNRLRLLVIRAEMMCLGGRAQNVFILCLKDCDRASVCFSSLKSSMKQALGRVAASSDMLPSDHVFSSKRRKMIIPSH